MDIQKHPFRPRSSLSKQVGDPDLTFRKLGGFQRLDIIASYIGAVIASIISCLLFRSCDFSGQKSKILLLSYTSKNDRRLKRNFPEMPTK